MSEFLVGALFYLVGMAAVTVLFLVAVALLITFPIPTIVVFILMAGWFMGDR